MNEFDFIESLKVLNYKEGDTIVLKSKNHIPPTALPVLKASFEKAIPEIATGKVKVMVLGEGIDIEVLRKED